MPSIYKKILGLIPKTEKEKKGGSLGLSLLASHWLGALGKQSRGCAAVLIQGRHLGGKFRGEQLGVRKEVRFRGRRRGSA